MRLAIADGLLATGKSIFDYGCGRGGDVRHLKRLGYRSSGWDPVFARDQEKKSASVVNLGYVVNVVEDPVERELVLKDAWGLAETTLVIAARLAHEREGLRGRGFSDGVVTGRGTFQKFYEQQELRAWIDRALGVQSVPAAPGVFYVFRDQERRESFVASRYRARRAAPVVRRSEELFEANRDVLEPLIEFLNERGRPPDGREFAVVPEIEKRLGSLRRAIGIVRRVTDPKAWDQVQEERASELAIYLGLIQFEGRPKMSALPLELQLDVRAFFGSYKAACLQADELLYSAGDLDRISAACAESPVGKLTPPALYVHVSAMKDLSPLLRIYEGCARAYTGTLEGTSLVKLHRDEPKISYLTYPAFDRSPHPKLARSFSVHLQTFRMRDLDYSERENPPILHRKELFVSADYPHRNKFEKLTRQEERFGLYEDASRIGTLEGWNAALTARGVRLSGHRVVRSSAS